MLRRYANSIIAIIMYPIGKDEKGYLFAGHKVNAVDIDGNVTLVTGDVFGGPGFQERLTFLYQTV